jgi:hypothetical protein
MKGSGGAGGHGWLDIRFMRAKGDRERAERGGE